MSDEQPIIIVKKKGGHAGHHGGAWKVAYSDFITSMMCFFLVMWLVTTASGATKKGIAEYFKDPGIFDKTQHGSPLALGSSGLLPDEGYQPKSKSGREFEKIQNKINKKDTKDNTFINGGIIKKGDIVKGETKDKKHINELSEGDILDGQIVQRHNKEDEKIDVNKLSKEDTKKVLDQIKEKIKKEIEEKLKKEIEGDNPSLLATQKLKDFLGEVEITVDGSGINIDIIDTEKVSMFPIGSSKMHDKAKNALFEIARTLKDLPNEFEIIGHTDSLPYANNNNYTNWELSTERANSARRILEDAGINSNKIVSVQGRADKDLKVKDDPFSPKNRRITLRMNFAEEELLNLSKEQNIKETLIEEENKMSRVMMRINKQKVKSIHSKRKFKDDEDDEDDIDDEDSEDTKNKEKTKTPTPVVDKKKARELEREQALEEIIKRNSKKPSIAINEKSNGNNNELFTVPVVPIFN